MIATVLVLAPARVHISFNGHANVPIDRVLARPARRGFPCKGLCPPVHPNGGAGIEPVVGVPCARSVPTHAPIKRLDSHTPRLALPAINRSDVADCSL